ncbi:MAG: hypothetical protein KGH64_00795 [Candidatus Micrarchaeota archaeon]|nr:hypothetical protein [Candidatus Micrarchaeota archaeon]
MMALNYGILVAYIILISIAGMLAAIVVWRKLQSWKMFVWDLRNPRKEVEVFYAMKDKGSGQIRMYKTLLHPWSFAMMPPRDLRMFIDNGIIKGYRGVSGHMEDDNIVLMKAQPLMGQVSASLQSDKIADAVQSTISFMESLKKYSINDKVKFEIMRTQNGMMGLNAKREKELLEGIVSDIGYKGLTISTIENRIKEVDEMMENGKMMKVKKEVEVQVNYVFATETEIQNAQIKITEAVPEKERITANLNMFFSPEWVMSNFGLIPIDNDANVFLRGDKDAMATFNSNIDAMADAKKSWLARNMLLVGFIMMGFMLFVGFVIESYAVQQFLSNFVSHNAAQFQNSILYILNHTANAGHPIG